MLNALATRGFLGLFAVLCLLILPSFAWSPIVSAPLTLMLAGLAGILGAVAIYGRPVEKSLVFTSLWCAGAGIIAIATSLRGGISYHEFTGFAMTSETLAALFGALLMVIVACAISSPSLERWIVRVAGYSAAGVALIMWSADHSIVELAFGPLWFDGVVYVAVGIALLVPSMLFSHGRRLLFDGIAFTLCVVLLLFSGDRELQFLMSSILVLAALLAHFRLKMLNRVALLLCCAAIIGGVAFFAAAQFRPNGVLSGSYLIARPSFTATFDVIERQFMFRPLAIVAGAKPQGFNQVWAFYRAPVVSRTPAWNTDFDSGSSLLLTWVALHGVLLPLWLSVGFVFLVYRISRQAFFDPKVAGASSSILLASFILAYVIATRVPSTQLLLIFGVFVGMFRVPVLQTPLFEWTAWPAVRAYLLPCAVMLVGALLLYSSVVRIPALVAYDEAVRNSGANGEPSDTARSIALLEESVAIEPLSRSEQMLSTYYNYQISKIASSSRAMSPKLRRIFTDLIGTSINHAESAVEQNRQSYQNWIALGDAHMLASLYDPRFLLKAESDFEAARASGPTLPLTYVKSAETALILGKKSDAFAYAMTARALKLDYTQASTIIGNMMKEVPKNQ